MRLDTLNMDKKQHKKVKKYKKKNSFWDIPVWMCIVFILFGCALGGIFSYDSLYLNKTIHREEAIIVTGHFDSYELLYTSKSAAVNEVRINFVDREELYIGAAYHVEMDEKLEGLEKGEQLNMLLHPNSEYIWEMTSDNAVILSFDDAKSRTQFETAIFMVFLVGFCAICISMGVIALFVKYFNYKKKRRNKKTATCRGSV